MIVAPLWLPNERPMYLYLPSPQDWAEPKSWKYCIRNPLACQNCWPKNLRNWLTHWTSHANPSNVYQLIQVAVSFVAKENLIWEHGLYFSCWNIDLQKNSTLWGDRAGFLSTTSSTSITLTIESWKTGRSCRNWTQDVMDPMVTFIWDVWRCEH